MIKVICGMIGSGKTTYALNNKKPLDILLDWDLIREALKTDDRLWIKEIQVILLRFYYTKGFNIWYITTKLGDEEAEQLRQMNDVDYIWINTTKQQCIENIKARNRNGEASNINELIKANERIYNDYYINKDINYKIVEVFDSGERW